MSAVTARLAVLAAICAGLASCASRPATSPGASQAVSAAGDVNARQGDGSTPLQWAVYNSDIAEVARLIKAGADVSLANSYGATPMSLAANTGNAAIIKLLLDAGADVESPNAEGQTALMAVARTGSVDEAMRLLEAAGANPDARTNDSTPLHVATTRGWTDVMKELASYGVDVNAKDSDGLTALDYSLARARIGFLQQKLPVRNDLAKVLRDLGANVENPNLPPWPPVPTPTITAQVPE